MSSSSSEPAVSATPESGTAVPGLTGGTPPVGYLLTKVAQATAARFAETLAELDIRPRHYALLAAAAAAPGRTQQQLSHLLGVAPSAVVAAVDDLERLGAVERVPDRSDRRRFAIRLTPAGTDLFEEATRRGEAVDDETLGALSASRRRELAGSLAAVVASLDLLPSPQD